MIRIAVLTVFVAGMLAGCGGDDPPPPPPKALPKVLRIVFPEGFTREQMTDRVGAVRQIAEMTRQVTMRMTPTAYHRATGLAPISAPFRKDAKGQIEGFLFPATYAFFHTEPATRFVRRQVRAFDNAWRTIDMRYARSKNLTPYDVLIIASMIEREVVVPRERRLVAAVIYNRLRGGMPLGIDATLRYGLRIPPTEPISQSDLESESPFNTRKRTGLPPTPIANPGLAAMRAAAHPARVDYLYFIRKPDCRSHFFTASDSEFLAYSRQGLQCGG